MGMLRCGLVIVGGQGVPGKCTSRLVVGRRVRQLRVRGSRQELAGFGVFQDLGHIDDADCDRLMGTGLDACGGFSHSQSVRAHIALANDPFLRVVLGDVVRTGQGAVLTADALVIQVLHDPRDRVLFIGIDRTPLHTAGVQAVMTGGRHMLHQRVAGCATHQQTDIAPGFRLIETVQSMAGCHARFAAGTAVEIDLKGILLTWPRRLRGEQCFVVLGLERSGLVRVVNGEPLDSGELLLIGEEISEE